MIDRSVRRIGLLIACALAVLCGTASAHAFLDHADPAVGSTLDHLPAAVNIWFTHELEPAFCSIEVTDSDGKQVDQKDTHADEKDAKKLIVSLGKLAAGVYKVSWQVVCTDTHKTHGDFKFEVRL